MNRLKNQNLDKGTLIGLLALMLWSTAASAFKLALNSFSVFQVLFIATFVSTIIFMIYEVAYCIKIKKIKIPKINLKLIKLSILNPFLYYLILFQAYNILPAQMALTLNYLWPIILIVLFIITKRIIYNINLVYSIIISFIGFLILTSKGESPLNTKNINFDMTYLFGVILALFSAFVWAYYWLLNSEIETKYSSKNTKINKEDSLFINFILSFIYLTVYGLILKYNEILELFNFEIIMKNSGIGLYSSIYIGFFEMGFTFLIWRYSISNSLKKEVLSNLVYISPVLSLIWISLFLNEKIYITTYVGFILILLGIFYQKIKEIFLKLKN